MNTVTKDAALWDAPTRIFHWGIVVCLPLSWWSAEEENYDLHQWLGYTMIVLVVSRIVWGLVGSVHSRFSDFLVGPRKAFAYLRGQKPATPGHNPLGGWSVMVLLALLLAQAISGLFNTDEVFFNGPMYYAVSSEVRDTMGWVHELAFDTLLAFIGLHILAVLYYQFFRKERLIQPMIMGRVDGRSGNRAPVPVWRWLLIVALVALALWAVLQTAPPPPAMMW